MKRTVLKLILKGTFIGISFFAISLYSPLIYAQNNGSTENIKFDASSLVTVTEKLSNSANGLLISTSNAVNYLSVGKITAQNTTNNIPSTPNAIDRITPLQIDTQKDIKDTAIETLSYSPSNSTVDLTNSTDKKYIQAALNKDRKPSYTYIYSKITPEEAAKFYILSIILFTVGTILVTNKWLYNFNPSLSFLSNDELDFSKSVILEQ